MTAADRLEQARAFDLSGETAKSLDQAWLALADGGGAPAKAMVSSLLQQHPELATSSRREAFAALLDDPDLDPSLIAAAGWSILVSEGLAVDSVEAIAGRLERDRLALALLEQSPVSLLEAELALTRVRRWLLMDDRSRDYPSLTSALRSQIGHNEGAWWLDGEERQRLSAQTGTAIAAAYPPKCLELRPGFESENDSITKRVVGQYRRWPYPRWSRIGAVDPTDLPALVEAIDPGGNPALPRSAEILVAGCGTGREAAILASRLPDAKITAIDVSETSLAYAERQCAGLGIRFHRLDLHCVKDLGRSFDMISSSGVLHHLPDPEAGWQALLEVLRPGGVLRLMLYSRLGRLRVSAARTHVVDLIGQPIDDDLLRSVRRRLIDKAPNLLARSLDFYTLSGVHDLLLHEHEDPFDVPRIRSAVRTFGIDFLGFVLPTVADRERYRRSNPDDPLFRDFGHWAALEKAQPFLFAGMYQFWCRKPVAPATAVP